MRSPAAPLYFLCFVLVLVTVCYRLYPYPQFAKLATQKNVHAAMARGELFLGKGEKERVQDTQATLCVWWVAGGRPCLFGLIGLGLVARRDRFLDD